MWWYWEVLLLFCQNKDERERENSTKYGEKWVNIFRLLRL